MAKYYRSKKSSKSRGWMRRNLGRAGSALKKRYYSGGKLSLSKVASDAKYALSIAKTAKGLLNTEKKRYEFNQYSEPLGQVEGNVSGHYIYEITPVISQGTGYGNRVGSSISLRSYCMHIQLAQQSSNAVASRITFYVVQSKAGEDFDIYKFFQYNKPLYAQNSVAVFDTHCQRDPDHFADYLVLRRKTVVMPIDGIASVTQSRDVNLKLNFGKYGKHIRFGDNTNTTTNTRIFLIAVTSDGNCSTSTTSTLTGIPVTAVNTGIVMHLDGVAYFIDN